MRFAPNPYAPIHIQEGRSAAGIVDPLELLAHYQANPPAAASARSHWFSVGYMETAQAAGRSEEEARGSLRLVDPQTPEDHIARAEALGASHWPVWRQRSLVLVILASAYTRPLDIDMPKWLIIAIQNEAQREAYKAARQRQSIASLYWLSDERREAIREYPTAAKRAAVFARQARHSLLRLVRQS